MINSQLHNRDRIRSVILCSLLSAFSLFAYTGIARSAPSETPSLQLSSSVTESSAGFYTLSWSNDLVEVELQEATDSRFLRAKTLYIGSDNATVISGKPDGTWYYRLRTVSGNSKGPWTDPVPVVVKHHELSKGLVFFSTGLLIFIILVVFIVVRMRKTQ